MAATFPCPACGFLVFDEPPGSYNICRICGWEDDHVQLAHPRLQGGASRECLLEAQVAVLAEYPVSIREVDGIARDPKWRPLTVEETVIRDRAPRSGLDYFRAASVEEPTYYWLKDTADSSIVEKMDND
jgi:hypothetical protein